MAQPRSSRRGTGSRNAAPPEAVVPAEPLRPAAKARPPRAGGHDVEPAPTRELVEKYLEQVLADPRSQLWSRLFDSTQWSVRVAESVVTGMKLDKRTRAELVQELIAALGLEPELGAKLAGLLNERLIGREQREAEFIRAAGQLVYTPDEDR